MTRYLRRIGGALWGRNMDGLVYVGSGYCIYCIVLCDGHHVLVTLLGVHAWDTRPGRGAAGQEGAAARAPGHRYGRKCGGLAMPAAGWGGAGDRWWDGDHDPAVGGLVAFGIRRGTGVEAHATLKANPAAGNRLESVLGVGKLVGRRQQSQQ